MYRFYHFVFILTLFSQVSFGSYLVLSSKSDAVKEKLELRDLKQIFLGKKIFWQDGERIFRVHINQESKEMKVFLESILNMTSAQFNKYWRRKLFAGKGHPPTEFNTEKEALSYIAETPGSIGIVGQLPNKKISGLFFFKPSKNGQHLDLIK